MTTTRKTDDEIKSTESKMIAFVKPPHLGCTVSTRQESISPRPVAESIALTLQPNALLYVAYYLNAGVLTSREVVAWSAVVADGTSSAFALVLDTNKGRLLPVDRFPGFIKILGWIDRDWNMDQAAQRLGLETEAQKLLAARIKASKAKNGGAK